MYNSSFMFNILFKLYYRNINYNSNIFVKDEVHDSFLNSYL